MKTQATHHGMRHLIFRIWLAGCLVMAGLIPVLSSPPLAVAQGSLSWTQTTQSDFTSGTLWQVDASVSPGDVTLQRKGSGSYYENFFTTTYKDAAATTADWNTTYGQAQLPIESEGWASQTSGTTQRLNDVCFVNATTGWAVGGNGTVLTTTNGATWAAAASPAPHELNGVFFVSATTGWVAGAYGDIYKTTNGGASWSQQYFSPSLVLNAAYFADADTGWMVGNSGGVSPQAVIMRTTNGGSSWSTVTSDTTSDLHSVHFANSDTGWAVGENGVVLHTDDGGDNWTLLRSGGVALNGVYFGNTSVGWAVGDDGTILKTTDGGYNWTSQTSGTTNDLNDVHFEDAFTGWAVGDSGTIQKTINGGSTWASQTSGTNRDLQGLWMVDAHNGWTVGDHGTICKYSMSYSATATAQSLTIDTVTQNIIRATLTANHVVTAGQAITYYLSNDGGSTWEQVTSGIEHAFSSNESDLRWRALLSTANDQTTPIIDDLTVVYEATDYDGSYYDTGGLESSSFDTGSQYTTYAAISWNPTSQPVSCTLKFQVATNNDNATWQFTGPDGTDGTYYTTASGQSIWSEHNNNRYIKYKAFFDTTDNNFTPVLSDVTITYTSPRIKSLHLLESGISDDLMRTQPGSSNTAITLDGGASHVWTQDPDFAADFSLHQGDLAFQYYLSAASGGVANRPTISVTLFYDSTYIGGASQETSDTGRHTLVIANPNITVPVGSALSLQVANTNPREQSWFTMRYNGGGNYDSQLDMPTNTYVNVEQVTTLSTCHPEGSTTFSQGQAMTITARVSDPFGSYDIAGAGLEVTDPGGAAVVPGLAMTPAVTATGAITYEHIYALPPTATLGLYTVVVTGTESNGVYATRTTIFYVQSPAALTSSLSAAPATVNTGQAITVTMVVTNSGQATASSVTPITLTLGGTGSAVLASGPSPPSADIPGGGTAAFTWVYTATGIGTVNWSGNATGSDANSCAPVSSPDTSSNDVLVQTPVALLSSLSALPAQVNTGQAITVTMVVTNSGQATAEGVAPSTLTLDGTGSAVLASGPSPPSADIPGGGTAAFTWVYTATGAGTVNWSGYATGIDANSGAPVFSSSTTSNQVVIEGLAPMFEIITSAGGQTIRVRVQMVNGQPEILSWEILP